MDIPDDAVVQSEALPRIHMMSPDSEPLRPRRSRSAVAVEALRAAPNLAKLVYRLLRDPRVPRRSKMLLAGAAAYFASPVDLVPEMLFPIVGRIDDVIVLAFALDRLFRSVDHEVVAAHWDGEGDALELVSALVGWAGGMLPSPLRRMLAS